MSLTSYRAGVKSPLARLLQDRLNLPARLENDANAAALGEWRFGAGRGTASLVFVTVSTGIGGGVISDNRIVHGRRGLTVKSANAITNESERCHCGAVGCFEAVTSGTALGRHAMALTKPGDGSALRTLSHDREVTGRHVVETARGGDEAALGLIDREAHWLGIGFTNLLHLYSPDMIVMGGGISHGYNLLRKPLEATIQERAMPAFRDVPVVPNSVGMPA
jgi:glucokinase